MQPYELPFGPQLWWLLHELVLLPLLGVHELRSRVVHGGSSGRYTHDSSKTGSQGSQSFVRHLESFDEGDLSFGLCH